RKMFRTLDTLGHVVSTQIDGLAALGFEHDSHGRLTRVTQGTRALQLDYGADGMLSVSTDALGQIVQLGRDGAGRITSVTAPDMTQTVLGYDANGNLTGVTPPSRPQHSQEFTAVDLFRKYTPPVVSGSGSTSTTFTYDLDRMLTDVLRPDGLTVHRDYDS